MSKQAQIVAVICLVLGLGIGLSIHPDTPGPEPVPTPVPVTPVPDPVPDTPAEGDPIRVEVGELVRLTEPSGSRVAWSVEPPIVDIETYGARNESSVSSYRTKGVYTVIAAIAEGGWTSTGITIKRYTVVVGDAVPTPGPSPNPEPNPGPAPGPAPEPVPTPVVSDLSDLAKLVPDKVEAQRLAAAFREAADEVDALIKKRKLLSPDEIVALTQEATEKALGSSVPKWEKFFAATEDALTKRAKDGKLSTMTQHVTTWRELAQVLENAG